MLPLGDDNPRRSTPLVTLALIAANVVVFLSNNLGATEDEQLAFSLRWGFDSGDPFSRGVLTYQFLHGNLLHILGNMWVLWIVGDNVEDKLGRVRYLVLYLLGGMAAAWTFAAIGAAAGPNADALGMIGREQFPLVGASGAIATVMGIYLVFFPEARIRVLIWFFLFVQVIKIPAKAFIGISLALDLMRTIAAQGPAHGGVATAAHVGGGVFGVVAALLLKRSVGGSGHGDAWDVHTGFSRTVHPGSEPVRAKPAERAGWFAPPEPMEDGAAEVEDALIELVRAGRLREAIDVYPGYVSLRRERPLPADVQLEIAHEFYRQGLARDGIGAYVRFLDTEPRAPEAPEAAFRIGILYARGLGDARSAVPWLRKASETHTDPRIAAYAADELRRLGG